ncbi:helix-turn-helix domain-containing protein [Paenibacillus marinisediminis]
MTELRIASNLVYLRKEMKLTQDAMADKLGVTFQAVSKWENGQTFPDITLLPELSKLFKRSIDDLLLHDVSQPNSGAAQHGHISTDATGGSYNNEFTSSADGQYSIKLFHNDIEVAAFSELDERIDINLTGTMNSVDSAFSINCGCVEGNVNAGGSVTCDYVEGSVVAGGSITCDSVQGDVRAGGSLTCDSVDGDAHAGGNITCDSIEGNAKAGNMIQCDTIQGDASAGFQVICNEVASH